jgi:hypothetical protein
VFGGESGWITALNAGTYRNAPEIEIMKRASKESLALFILIDR